MDWQKYFKNAFVLILSIGMVACGTGGPDFPSHSQVSDLSSAESSVPSTNSNSGLSTATTSGSSSGSSGTSEESTEDEADTTPEEDGEAREEEESQEDSGEVVEDEGQPTVFEARSEGGGDKKKRRGKGMAGGSLGSDIAFGAAILGAMLLTVGGAAWIFHGGKKKSPDSPDAEAPTDPTKIPAETWGQWDDDELQTPILRPAPMPVEPPSPGKEEEEEQRKESEGEGETTVSEGEDETVSDSGPGLPAKIFDILQAKPKDCSVDS